MADLIIAGTASAKPDYVTALETAYGVPSQAGFGSAVFFEIVPASADLAAAALVQYKFFVGDLWDRYGEAAWMGPWRQVYTRPSGATPAIVAELRARTDTDAALSASVLLDNAENADRAQAALSAAFDDPAVTELAVYNLGDGGAMNGVLVAGWRKATREASFLLLLLD